MYINIYQMMITERIAARKTPNVIQCVLLDPSEIEKEKFIISSKIIIIIYNNNKKKNF